MLPWVVMAIMSGLMYENMGLAALLIALLGFVSSLLGRKNKGISRTPELISLLLTTMAAAIEVMNPLWIANISLPLGLLVSVLFLIIGNINWED